MAVRHHPEWAAKRDRYFKPDRNPVTLRVLSDDSVNTPAGRFAAIAIRP